MPRNPNSSTRHVGGNFSTLHDDNRFQILIWFFCLDGKGLFSSREAEGFVCATGWLLRFGLLKVETRMRGTSFSFQISLPA